MGPIWQRPGPCAAQPGQPGADRARAAAGKVRGQRERKRAHAGSLGVPPRQRGGFPCCSLCQRRWGIGRPCAARSVCRLDATRSAPACMTHAPTSLQAAGEFGARLGALPYHRERGSDPAGAGVRVARGGGRALFRGWLPCTPSLTSAHEVGSLSPPSGTGPLVAVHVAGRWLARGPWPRHRGRSALRRGAEGLHGPSVHRRGGVRNGHALRPPPRASPAATRWPPSPGSTRRSRSHAHCRIRPTGPSTSPSA